MLSIDAGSTIPIQKERNAQLIVEFQPKKYREAPDLGSEGGSGGNSSSTSSVSLQYTAVRPISDFVGNYFYASPEIVSGTGLYDQSVDWWAVGVMLFHVLAGITPFEDKNEQKDITLGTSPIMTCIHLAHTTYIDRCPHSLTIIIPLSQHREYGVQLGRPPLRGEQGLPSIPAVDPVREDGHPPGDPHLLLIIIIISPLLPEHSAETPLLPTHRLLRAVRG